MKLRAQNIKPLIIIALLAVLYLCGLLFTKYHLNGLSFSEFRADYIGNILNLIITFFISLACILLIFGKQKVDRRKFTLLFSLQIVSILSLVTIYLVVKLDLIDSNTLIFNSPIKKVYSATFFILSFLLQIYSLIYMWGLIFGSEDLFELRTLVRTIFTVVILLIFSLLYVWNVKVYDESKIEKSVYDYGFVPGAAVYSRGQPSPIFEARIRRALELYRKGIIKKIFLTGGNAPGEISESEAAYKYLTNLDVQGKNIIIENHSSTTAEQIKYLRTEILIIKDHSPVIIVSDGFHLSRIMQISKFFKVNAIGVASDYTLSFEKTIFYRARESVALLLFWLFAN